MDNTTYMSANDIIGLVLADIPASDNHLRASIQNKVLTWLRVHYTRRYAPVTKVINIEVPKQNPLWVDAPTDMINWVTLGIQHGDVIQPLDYNNRLAKIRANENTLPRYNVNGVVVGSDQEYVLPLWNQGRFGWSNWGGTHYGIGWGEYNGQFSYDQANCRFIFATPWPEQYRQVYLEYTYDCLNDLDVRIVEPIAGLACQYWVLAEYHLTKKDRGMHGEYNAKYTYELGRFLASYSLKKYSLVSSLMTAIHQNTIVGIS